ncbi:alkaline phosphatase family protein [Archangium primigenium]|uniref:alkaline phosphatase family protein n=1 Tax=[Archangium] primigenium TaxID=2792470 RepID=UPI00195DFCF3|nr:alkaline phosphatase family protein [Archangium primigenium]
MSWKKRWSGAGLVVLTACVGVAGCDKDKPTPEPEPTPSVRRNKMIIFVWDGLRPDYINAADTPNVHALRTRGVWFEDNHSTYPTFTLINGATFATGAFPAVTGFNGNAAYAPGPKVQNATGATADFHAPVFVDDWRLLDQLGKYYEETFHEPLLNADTLFAAAHGAGLKTATIGKSGPAYLQDTARGGVLIDENTVWPLATAEDMQQKGFKLPKNTPLMHPGLTLAADNGSPTGTSSIIFFSDGKTPDASDSAGGRHLTQNQNLADYYTGYVLPQVMPDLSLIWLRTVDAAQHDYGPGSANALASLRLQDKLLGQIVSTLEARGELATTNILIASDHSHSSVSGPLSLFPLRGVTPDGTTGKNTAGEVSATGFSASGFVRSADLLTRAGFHAYDGSGCDNSPVLSGIRADGTPVYPQRTDTEGALCGTKGARYTTPAYAVPATLPADAIIIAAPGGSDQFYIPSHDPALVKRLVSFLQSREEYGAIFVDSRYGDIPGTFRASAANLENASGRSPDVTVSFMWDDQASINGKPGIEYNSYPPYRGMHGSFSPVDVHNTLIASGPDFKAGVNSTLPSGNTDVAPTVAHLLGLSLPTAQGRVLVESLLKPPSEPALTVKTVTVEATPVSGLQFQMPTDPSGATLDTALQGNYSAVLQMKQLDDGQGKTFTYFDLARVTRK